VEEIGSRAPPASAVWLLFMLASVGFCQQMDKILFSIMMEPIRRELHLSDAQLGLLNGAAFALFFGVAAIPLARLAERIGRRHVIAGSVIAWSFFTALTALATSFAGLFATRTLVGIGEAGSSPAGHSLVAARFPPERRAGAISLMLTGGYLGMTAGLALGGLLVDRLGWRQAFVWLGLPGLLLGILFWLTIAEPARVTAVAPADASLSRFLTQVALRPRFLNLFAVFAGISISGYGMLAWAPAFYMRDFGMSASAVGFLLGAGVGLSNVVGALGGGAITNLMRRRFPKVGLRLSFWTILASVPVGVAGFAVHGELASIALLTLSLVLGAFCTAPLYAELHEMVAPQLRATAVAIMSLAIMLLGQGVGPVVVGLLSDATRGLAGQDNLRASLIVTTMISLWPLAHLVYLIRTRPAPDPA
jgi:predicted MFS family arabinose efflux permease